MTDEVKIAALDLTEQTKPTVAFDYIKSAFFRVIHVDGVLGGPGPRRNIVVNFFSERLPIPQKQVYALTPQRTVGEEVADARIVREGIVREVEAGLVMDLPTARSIMLWLGHAIADVERLDAERKRSQSPTDEQKGS